VVRSVQGRGAGARPRAEAARARGDRNRAGGHPRRRDAGLAEVRARYSVTYPSLRDVDTKLAREYGSNKVPETFVIDARGRIADVLRGQITEQRLDEALTRALR